MDVKNDRARKRETIEMTEKADYNDEIKTTDKNIYAAYFSVHKLNSTTPTRN